MLSQPGTLSDPLTEVLRRGNLLTQTIDNDRYPLSPRIQPSVGVPGSTTTITTVDANGNEITKKDTYREGVFGSSETQTKTLTDPDGGTTTRSKTTTEQR